MSKLIISIGSLSLDLIKFSSKNYRKLKTICDIEPTNIGGSKISMAVRPIKYVFDIKVNLSPLQRETLDLIISEHVKRISDKLVNPEIILQDRQNPILETETTPSRARAAGTSVTTLPAGIKYFPSFKCGVKEYNAEELVASFMCSLQMEEL